VGIPKAISDWWDTVPSWAKPVILAAVLAALLPCAAWLLKIFKKVLENFYLRLLEEFDTRRTAAYNALFARMPSSAITNERISEEMGPIRLPWFTARALKWRRSERLRKKHLSLPPTP
jgi:hypothetical protein